VGHPIYIYIYIYTNMQNVILSHFYLYIFYFFIFYCRKVLIEFVYNMRIHVYCEKSNILGRYDRNDFKARCLIRESCSVSYLCAFTFLYPVFFLVYKLQINASFSVIINVVLFVCVEEFCHYDKQIDTRIKERIK